MPSEQPHPDPSGLRADEARLIRRAQERDRASFGFLYRAHYSAIAGYLYRRTGDVHTAEDLAADTFLSAYNALPGYRVTAAPFRMWLLRIATNAANRWARERQRLKLSRIAPAPDARDQTLDRQATAEEAQAALLALDPDHQAVLSLHYLESLSLDDVGAVLGCPAGTVKSRLSRARAALREVLQRRSQRHG